MYWPHVPVVLSPRPDQLHMHPSIATPKTSFEAKRSRAAPARAVSLPMARLFRVAGRWQTTLDLLRAAHATVQPASTRHATTTVVSHATVDGRRGRDRPARSRQEVACQPDAVPRRAAPHHDQLLPTTVDVYVVRAAGHGRPGLQQQRQRWQQWQPASVAMAR